MKDYTITRYSFDELSDEAKETAIAERRNLASSEDISWLLEMCLNDELAELLGTSSPQPRTVFITRPDLSLYFSLSYSQGDGVALDGQITPATAPGLSWPNGAVYGYVKHRGRYYHEHSFTLTLCDEEGNEIESALMLEELRGICRKLAREGYSIMEHDQSRENAIEWIENNTADDYTAEGKFKPITEEKVSA